VGTKARPGINKAAVVPLPFAPAALWKRLRHCLRADAQCQWELVDGDDARRWTRASFHSRLRSFFKQM